MPTNHNNITPELVRAALQFIPAQISRDEWAKIGMAIKSEFADDQGRDLFTTWSATADNFDAKAAQSTWKSIKPGGGVTIATLLAEAKQHGFVMPRGNQLAAKPDAQTVERQARERAARQQAEKAEQDKAHADAADCARELWAAASDTGTSGYLQRKGIQPYGVRFGADGWLLVPLRDASGKLWNVQRIAPTKPTSGTDKLFLKDGRKSGLWHWCGDPAQAGVLLICEGLATASSAHEATGHPVAVAFDAGNLVHVAKALRKAYPSALLVIAGDDDTSGPVNTGRTKAEAAAAAVRGLAVFPQGLTDGQSDWCDLHQAVGLEAVRTQIDSAIAEHQSRQSAAAADTQKSAQSEATPDWDRFLVTDAGVFYEGIDQEGNKKPPVWVCSRLNVEARTRDQDGGGWGYLLTFNDPLGKPKQWAMPARMLSGDGGEYRATLLGMGLLISSTPASRNLLTQYIQTRRPQEFASCTDKTGWHNGSAFVLPHETIGDAEERIVFQTESAMENTFRCKGTAEQWRERVGAMCAGNTRLVFSVACAFAGPLLRPAGMESGGANLVGNSSSGKTTCLRVAASVFGGVGYMQRWRTTDSALESIAAQRNDCLLLLDELAQVDPKVAGECSYLLANEVSKSRASRSGSARPRLTWRLLFLSAGEVGLADHMAEGMKKARTGQEVRMVDIPADAGKGFGVFEELHGMDGGSNFSRYLTDRAASVYGTTGREWLQWLCANASTLKARIREASKVLAAEMVPTHASGQVERVAARFALVGAAGELATEAGLTGWQPGESERAALSCFNAWLAARGSAGNGEVVAMLRQVRRFLESHGESRLTLWHRAGDDHNSKTMYRAGFRRVFTADGDPFKDIGSRETGIDPSLTYVLDQGGTIHYYILPECFRTEVCQGFDYKAVARVLIEHGCLIPSKGRPFDSKHRLPGMGGSPVACYEITDAIFRIEL